ncbi:universal stress protein [Halopenitus sp. H-Gu1]|uniref:universal stress protein n=1 Tax=Halopenitus sp. H-Gu1 TaxID=3242697 RepID=UPI00359D96F9
MQPSHVLVPMDGSPLAGKALEHALAVFDCEVTVLNIITPLDSPLSEGGVLEVDETRFKTAQERSENLIERASRQAETAGREIETVIETGEPAKTILAYVDTHDVDQIVMGAHGGEQGRIARRLLGTVATAVVGDAPVTVTVVR